MDTGFLLEIKGSSPFSPKHVRTKEEPRCCGLQACTVCVPPWVKALNSLTAGPGAAKHGSRLASGRQGPSTVQQGDKGRGQQQAAPDCAQIDPIMHDGALAGAPDAQHVPLQSLLQQHSFNSVGMHAGRLPSSWVENELQVAERVSSRKVVKHNSRTSGSTDVQLDGYSSQQLVRASSSGHLNRPGTAGLLPTAVSPRHVSARANSTTIQSSSPTTKNLANTVTSPLWNIEASASQAPSQTGFPLSQQASCLLLLAASRPQNSTLKRMYDTVPQQVVAAQQCTPHRSELKETSNSSVSGQASRTKSSTDKASSVAAEQVAGSMTYSLSARVSLQETGRPSDLQQQTATACSTSLSINPQQLTAALEDEAGEYIAQYAGHSSSVSNAWQQEESIQKTEKQLQKKHTHPAQPSDPTNTRRNLQLSTPAMADVQGSTHMLLHRHLSASCTAPASDTVGCPLAATPRSPCLVHCSCSLSAPQATPVHAHPLTRSCSHVLSAAAAQVSTEAAPTLHTDGLQGVQGYAAPTLPPPPGLSSSAAFMTSRLQALAASRGGCTDQQIQGPPCTQATYEEAHTQLPSNLNVQAGQVQLQPFIRPADVSPVFQHTLHTEPLPSNKPLMLQADLTAQSHQAAPRHTVIRQAGSMSQKSSSTDLFAELGSHAPEQAATTTRPSQTSTMQHQGSVKAAKPMDPKHTYSGEVPAGLPMRQLSQLSCASSSRCATPASDSSTSCSDLSNSSWVLNRAVSDCQPSHKVTHLTSGSTVGGLSSFRRVVGLRRASSAGAAMMAAARVAAGSHTTVSTSTSWAAAIPGTSDTLDLASSVRDVTVTLHRCASSIRPVPAPPSDDSGPPNQASPEHALVPSHTASTGNGSNMTSASRTNSSTAAASISVSEPRASTANKHIASHTTIPSVGSPKKAKLSSSPTRNHNPNSLHVGPFTVPSTSNPPTGTLPTANTANSIVNISNTLQGLTVSSIKAAPRSQSSRLAAGSRRPTEHGQPASPGAALPAEQHPAGNHWPSPDRHAKAAGHTVGLINMHVTAGEQARKAQERLAAYRQAQADRVRQAEADERLRRQRAVEARQEANRLKERTRTEVYAMNAILRMCDAAQVKLLLQASASATQANDSSPNAGSPGAAVAAQAKATETVHQTHAAGDNTDGTSLMDMPTEFAHAV